MALSYLPEPLRRFGVAVIERARALITRVRTRVGGNKTTRLGSWAVAAAAVAALLVLPFAENFGADTLNELLLYLPGVDKVLHLVQAVAILVVLTLLLRGRSLSTRSCLAIAAGGTLTVAVFDEFQQGWAAGRSMELADIGAATAGVAVGLGVLALRANRRVAAATILAGLVAGSSVTYASYLRTRDYNRGVLAERQGRRGDALRHYQAAVQAHVQHPEVYNALAWTMIELGEGNPNDAVAYAEQSLAMRPNNPDTLDTYGWALYRAGRVSDAVRPLEEALAAKPDIYCIHYHLAMVYLDLGRREDGRRHLRQQIELMPRTNEATLSADVLARLERSGRRDE